jgi:hypothetical protein
MNTNNFIPLHQLCTHYHVEIAFFNELCSTGLIEIETIEHAQYIHAEEIIIIEKILRLYHELDVNMEGIDVILNLLNKLNEKESEIISLKNKLRMYEN